MRGAARHVDTVSHQMLSLSHLCFGSLDRITHHHLVLKKVMKHQAIRGRAHCSPLRIGAWPTPRLHQSDRACATLGLIVRAIRIPYAYKKVCTAISPMTYLSRISRHFRSALVCYEFTFLPVPSSSSSSSSSLSFSYFTSSYWSHLGRNHF
jgi:hypothetical protein